MISSRYTWKLFLIFYKRAEWALRQNLLPEKMDQKNNKIKNKYNFKIKRSLASGT